MPGRRSTKARSDLPDRAFATFADMRRSVPFLLAFLFWSCGDGKYDAVKRSAETDSTANAMPSTVTAPIDLASYAFPLRLTPPAPAEGNDSLQVHWSEEFGRLEVRAGDHFGVNITEGFGDIGRLKADLGRDMLQKNTILQEEPDRLIYRSEFPDGDLVYIHFFRILRVGDRIFEVTDAEGGRYTEADVNGMIEAVSPLPPA